MGGCSSVVERHVANVAVVGSSPITRSFRPRRPGEVGPLRVRCPRPSRLSYLLGEPPMPDEPRSETSDQAAGTATEPEPGKAPEAEPPKKLTQQVDIRDAGPCKKHIKVTVERADIDSVLNKKFSELVVDANVS